MYPFGNECHPETKRYRELHAQLANPDAFLKAEYRLDVDDQHAYVLTKSAYEWACTQVNR